MTTGDNPIPIRDSKEFHEQNIQTSESSSQPLVDHFAVSVFCSAKEWRSIGPVPGKLSLPSPNTRLLGRLCNFIWQHQGYHHLHLFVAFRLWVRETQKGKKRTLSNLERFGKINRDARVRQDVQ